MLIHYKYNISVFETFKFLIHLVNFEQFHFQYEISPNIFLHLMLHLVEYAKPTTSNKAT